MSRQLGERMSYLPRSPPHSSTPEGSNGLFPIIFQDAVKLFHQVGELLSVVFLNDGLSKVLPCFPGITNHSGCFFQGIRAGDISSLHRSNHPYPLGFKHSVSSCPTLPV
jgi:hypothetical protein